MRITKEHRRIARKKGWYEGHTKQDIKSWPYDEVQLCIDYEEGYYEWLDADVDSINPYGVYSENAKNHQLKAD